ncbi:MAG TPA: nickel pincer cofactor biosynthesis protein LarC [Vicinamibacteria bacterium]|nr:nickel pincer cofactor biosynthesis protein LarC [Vicinamibacteria bacterium]
MSRIVYFDCASGAAGDMLLGALVDLGLSLDALRAELARLPLGGYRLDARKVLRAGLVATKVDVVVNGRKEEPAPAHEHGHPHSPAHGHGHEHGNAHDHVREPHAGAHRRLADILGLIDRSTLDGRVKERATGLFRRLAEAEAAVHGTSAEEVHFHEVGAVDAIVDIVGGVVGLGWLGADRFVASPLNVGTGTVAMSHGTFAVPPPATARLLQGVPVYGAGEGELLTPTGALLVTGHATGYGPLPAMRPEAVGHGAGSRDTAGRPNVLRLIVGEEEAASVGDRVVVLETELDDMSPQLCGPLMDRLLAAGALDAFYTPIQMKKGRPGLLVRVLAEPRLREALEEVLFTETTTLGVRRQEWDRTVLEREVVPVETAYGTVGVKVGRRGGRVYNVQPEFEDCRRASEARGVPVKEVWAAALFAARAARIGRT